MYCSNCGQKVYNIMERCPLCNSDLSGYGKLQEISRNNLCKQFISVELPNRTFTLNGEDIVFENDVFQRHVGMALINDLNHFISLHSRSLVSKYSRYDEFDVLLEEVICSMINIADMTGDILYHYIVEITNEEVDYGTFIDEFLQKIELENSLDKLKEIIVAINEAMRELATFKNVDKSIKRSSRWVGGGFGLSGAILGSLQATLLNAGSDLLYGMQRAASAMSLDVYEQTQINQLKGAIFVNGNIQSIYSEYIKKVNLVSRRMIKVKIQEKYGETNPDTFTKLDDLQKRINIESISDQEREIAIKLYCMLLKENPGNNAVYEGIYKLKPELKEELITIATVFGMNGLFCENTLEIEYERMMNELSTIVDSKKYKEYATNMIKSFKHRYIFHFMPESSAKGKVLSLERKISK